jgi:hypothetical protein
MRKATRHHFFMIGSVNIKIYLLLFIDAALAAFRIPACGSQCTRLPAVHLCARIYNNSLAGQQMNSNLCTV